MKNNVAQRKMTLSHDLSNRIISYNVSHISAAMKVINKIVFLSHYINLECTELLLTG
jgi:hypothetical protein